MEELDMSEYLKQATDFLAKANAKCEIEFGGVARNENWKEKEKRNWYDVTITTPKGKMNFMFWDSIYNTEITAMTLEQYVEKKLRRRFDDMSYLEKKQAEKKLESMIRQNLHLLLVLPHSRSISNTLSTFRLPKFNYS